MPPSQIADELGRALDGLNPAGGGAIRVGAADCYWNGCQSSSAPGDVIGVVGGFDAGVPEVGGVGGFGAGAAAADDAEKSDGALVYAPHSSSDSSPSLSFAAEGSDTDTGGEDSVEDDRGLALGGGASSDDLLEGGGASRDELPGGGGSSGELPGGGASSELLAAAAVGSVLAAGRLGKRRCLRNSRNAFASGS